MYFRTCGSTATKDTVEASFFASRVIDVWNYLPENIVDFSSLAAFQRTITLVDFNVFLKYV